MSIEPSQIASQIQTNAKALRTYYIVAANLLVLILVLHVGYSAYILHTGTRATYPDVALYGAVSVSALFVEVLLARVAFMLAGRLGQLNDILYAIDLSAADIDVDRLAAAAKVLVALRRTESTLKVLDLEGFVEGAAGVAKK